MTVVLFVLGGLSLSAFFAWLWLSAPAWRRRKEHLEARRRAADNVKHELETSDPKLAGIDAGRESSPALGPDSPERGRKHGLRGGGGGPDDPGTGTRPADATRHVETTLGILSYAELAPHLARKVQLVEDRIETVEFDPLPLDDVLIRQLHEAICGDVVPQMAGFRRVDVEVGTHAPPTWPQVPVALRDYARDLQVRLDTLPTEPDDRLLETLAFAEGRLLFIHPFTDFNGRVTRVFLRLLLRRLDLNTVPLTPSKEETGTYLAALRAADQNNWRPLMDIWRARFERETP